MSVMTRGPLSPGVYWRRRLFVGLLALGLVIVAATWLRSGSDGSSDETPVAQPAGTVEEATRAVTVPQPGVTIEKKTKQNASKLALPSGSCKPADVVVTPAVEQAVAGKPVTIVLSLHTRTATACNWRIDRSTFAVKIVRGSQSVWESRNCRDGLQTQNVILRRSVTTEVRMNWKPWPVKRSTDGCPGTTQWLMPGELTVAASALGGEPTHASFELKSPKAARPKPAPPKPDHTAQHQTGNAVERIKQQQRQR